VSDLDELRAAQARILAASSAERRRIEGDLHDGVQQDLVAVSVALQLARRLAESDPSAADALLEETGIQVQEALDRVRALAQAIYPSSLPSRGLADALTWMADGRVEISPVTRYALEVEEAVYFSCVELLESAAEGATLRVWDDAGVLHFVLNGEADEAVGMRVRDRMAALGGRAIYDEPSPR
jgi:signal transduction histidine kinase